MACGADDLQIAKWKVQGLIYGESEEPPFYTENN